MCWRIAALLAGLASACGGIAVIDDIETDAPLEDPTLGMPCGGPDEATCGANTYCDRAEGVSCSGRGICEARPLSCDEAGPTACACDGTIYPNACIAQANGVEVVADAWCLMEANARTHVGNDRLTFMFQDPGAGVCIRMVAMGGVTPAYPVTMSGRWQPVSVSAFNSTDSCLNVNAVPPAPELRAAAATGSAQLETYQTPGLGSQFCRQRVALEIEVPDAPWLAQPFSISSPNTPVEGACP